MRHRRIPLLVFACMFVAASCASLCSAVTFEFQQGVSPDSSYQYAYAVIRNDSGNADMPHQDNGLLVGTKADTGPGDQGYLHTMLEFDLSSQVNELADMDISAAALALTIKRVDGTPKVDVYSYGSSFSNATSTWNDPDGDGNPLIGDTTPGGTLGGYIGTFGELPTTPDGDFSEITLSNSGAFVTAVENALATDQVLRLILVEDNPDLATRDIAFFQGRSTHAPSEMPRLTIVTPDPVLTVDRTTGSVTLTNPAPTIENIIGYSITSASGTLKASDADWESIADTNPSWIELVAEGGHDLSEAALNAPFMAITLANGGAIDLGNIWNKYFTEDLQMQLLIDDGSEEGQLRDVIVEFVPGAGGYGPFQEGDIDFDGDVDLDDFEKFGQHLHASLTGTSAAATYALGDMNGDLLSNYEDLVLFQSLYDAANGAGAFARLQGAAQVPEPATSVALCLALGGLLSLRVRTKGQPTRVATTFAAWGRCGRRAAQTGCVLAAGWLSCSVAAGVNLPVNATYTGGSDDGFVFTPGAAAAWSLPAPADVARLTLTGQGEGVANFASVQVTDDMTGVPFRASVEITINELTTNSTEVEADVGLMLFGADTTLSGGYLFDFNPLTELIRIVGADGGTVASSETFTYAAGETYMLTVEGSYAVEGQLRLMFTLDDPSSGPVSVSNIDTTPLTGQHFGYRLRTASVPGQGAFTGNIDYDNFSLTEVEEPVLTLQVNTTTGETSIKNTSGHIISLDYYEITGAANSLDVAGWNSLDQQESDDPFGQGWDVAGGSDDQVLSEFRTGGPVSIDLLGQLNLGAAFNEASGAGESLKFYYSLDRGPLVRGNIALVTSAGLEGDFNGDGKVDAADYIVWRNNFGGDEAVLGGNGNGDSVVDQLDYNLWKDNFGETAPGALGLASTQVPEPSSVVLSGMAACGMFYFARRRSLVMLPAKVATVAVAAMVFATAAQAITVERHYRMGDVDGEGDMVGAPGPEVNEVVNSASGPPVYDDAGTFEDLNQSGNPVYAAARAGAEPWAIAFDGSMEQYLYHATPLDNLASGSQGMQMWVNPDSSSLGSGRQGIVFNGTNGGGPAISADGHWSQYSAGTASPGSLAGTVLVEGGEWYHLAQHIFANTDTAAPDVVPGTGAARSHTSVIYVDGCAVSATNFNLGTSSGEFVIGAEGTDPSNFFSGILDDVKVYSSTVNNFDLLTDNEYIADFLPAAYEVGDLTFDGQVNEADVTAFIDGWRKEKVLTGANNQLWVGDLETLGWGDINLDGRVDLKDAYRLNKALQANGAAAVNFALLEGAEVPEPSGVVLMLGAVIAGAAGLKRLRA